jgi:formylglycine-generating enzyme required for sulfatase activity
VLVSKSPIPNGYRLPTEAEWAWVARYGGRPGEPRKYPWGKTLPVPRESENYGDSSASAFLGDTVDGYSDGSPASAPVDSFDADAAGFYNLGGNVAEWMHDLYTIYSSAGSAEIDPTGPSEGELHVIRGASWRHATITELRLSYRDYGKDPRSDLGFRVARYLD